MLAISDCIFTIDKITTLTDSSELAASKRWQKALEAEQKRCERYSLGLILQNENLKKNK